MTNRCPDSSELLSLALGQLSQRRSDALEAHLASCPHCQQEYATLVQLRDTVRSSTLPLPEGLAESTWQAIPNPRFPGLRQHSVAWGTGIAVITATGILLFLPGSPFRSTPGFAQVEKAMHKVKTATWMTTSSTVDQQGQEQNKSQVQIWVQMEPPRMATRSVDSGGFYQAISERGAFSAKLKSNLWVFNRPNSRSNSIAGLRAWLKELTLSPQLTPGYPGTSQPGSQSALRRSDWRLKENGSVLRFERTTDYPKTPAAPPTLETLKVDARSHRIIRRESVSQPKTQPASPNVFYMGAKIVDTDFRYDITLPKDIFTIPLPQPGRHYVFMDQASLSEPVPQADQESARRVINEAARTWTRRDVAGFMRLWDWDSQRVLEVSRRVSPPITVSYTAQQKQLWSVNAKNGWPYNNWAVEQIQIRPGEYSVQVRKSASDMFPPKLDKLYCLSVEGTILVRGGQGQQWKLSLQANLQRQPNGEFRFTTLTLSPLRRERL